VALAAGGGAGGGDGGDGAGGARLAEDGVSHDGPLALEEALYDRLGPVARRQAWLWRWRAWSLVLAGAAVAGLVLELLDERLGWGGPGWWVLLGLGVVGAIVYLHWRIEQGAPDLKALATRIERAHPELRALLLTAIAQAPNDVNGRFGYLQEQVLREAVTEAAPGTWSRAVPNGQLWGAGLGCAVAALGLLFVAGRSLLPEMPALFPDAYGLEVSPGDGEAERGTSVTVLARFTRSVPSRATLLVRPRGKAPSRVVMTKNLADPVFSASSPIVDGVVDYQIEYGGRRSKRFRITSFVLPELDRIDARVIYPRQPALPARDIEDVRLVSVAEGARVALTVRLNKPVAEAHLVGDDGSVVNLAPSGGRGEVQTVTFDPDRTRHYDVQLLDERRRPNRAPPRLTVEVHGNAAPKVTLSFPGHDVRVSPIEELTVEAKVSDDVGLVGYGVSYALAGKPGREVKLGGGGTVRTETAHLVIPLEELGAQPDDLLSYHVWAEDIAGNGERRRIWSDMYFAEVRPFEEHYQEGPSDSGGAAGAGMRGLSPADDLARRQKEIINATWKLEREEREGVPAAELHNDVEVVRKGQMEIKDATEAMRQEALTPESRAVIDEAVAAMVRAHGQLAVSLAQALDAEQKAYAWLLKLRLRDHLVARGRAGAGGQNQSDPVFQELDLPQRSDPFQARSEATAEDAPGREDRQVLNRLRDLAERQKTLTERIKELQVALQQARPEERETLQNRLKRLREEQQEMLGDMDDLLQRMDRPENRSRMAGSRQDLESTRARAAETSEALARGEAGRAVGAGTRTERALDRMREELQRRVSRGLSDEMRDLATAAKGLSKAQASLGDSIRKAADPKRPAGTPTERRGLAQKLREQKQGVSALLERMRQITEETESSAPLLSRKLYDTFRKAKLDGVERALDRMSDQLDHSFGAQAAADEPKVRDAVAALEKGVTDAAKGVLGDDAEALRLAQAELQALSSEMRGAGGAAAGRGRSAESGTPPTQPPPAQGAGGGAGLLPRGAGEAGRGSGSSNNAPPGPGTTPPSPLTAESFRAWAERLRDVQELLGDPGLRTEAARLLDRARALRGDARRHAEAPQWSVLETELVRPLDELRDRVNEELRRVAPDKDKLSPIDRDPVPSRYSELVRRYYKSLAGE
jgi:hypothetical protein